MASELDYLQRIKDAGVIRMSTDGLYPPQSELTVEGEFVVKNLVLLSAGLVVGATIDGERVVVTSPEVSQPTEVRFFFGGTAAPNLVNGVGLPASPFATETLRPTR